MNDIKLIAFELEKIRIELQKLNEILNKFYDKD